ncbi:squalene/phytoene synthase family protein [Leptolyngbya sp. FACHB-36]|uniref:squalene/phytoene synthase family protein n=1 Tax=Leptolyngbya sp. FACHB-36 TaxID=2692808 RepID=UPI0018EF4644
MSTLSSLVGSSQYDAVSDDSLKDEDNAAWVMTLEPDIRSEWLERISWIRLMDRLAETALIHPDRSDFQQFCFQWTQLNQGSLQIDSVDSEILTAMGARWFQSASVPQKHCLLKTWTQYFAALARYHTPHLTLQTIGQYETMLEELGGSLFQVLPFLSAQHRQFVRAFGALDQFYNTLRDLREDAERNICYLPSDLLDAFGVSRAAIVQLHAVETPGYRPMMQFWLEHNLPQLHRAASDLIGATDLHESWQILRDWSLYRYRRIEQVFRECNFDYVQFPHLYWAQVKQELPVLMAQLRDQPLVVPSQSLACCC